MNPSFFFLQASMPMRRIWLHVLAWEKSTYIEGWLTAHVGLLCAKKIIARESSFLFLFSFVFLSLFQQNTSLGFLI
jgi:hypothetical protein